MDALLITLQNLNSLFLGAGDRILPPTAGATALTVLDEQVATADLALALVSTLGATRSSVMLRHIDFESLGISIRRRFPAGFLGGRVKVVGKVLRVRMTNFPAAGKA